MRVGELTEKRHHEIASCRGDRNAWKRATRHTLDGCKHRPEALAVERIRRDSYAPDLYADRACEAVSMPSGNHVHVTIVDSERPSLLDVQLARDLKRQDGE